MHDHTFKTKPVWLRHGLNCQKCYDERRGDGIRKTNEKFIHDARKVHGDKYDYSKVEYKNNKVHILIICPIHGEFHQRPDHHLHGQGCPRCCEILNGLNKRLPIETFLERAREKHGDKYDYSKVVYESAEKSVLIICPIHGEFYQKPSCHMNGAGCPLCNESRLERNVALKLDEMGMVYERQKKFEWLGQQSLDFYLPQQNIAIECQGKQHFNSVEYFGGDEGFKDILRRDERKHRLCREHGIKIEYVVLNMINVNLDVSNIYENKIHICS